MARLAGIDLPRNKRIDVALTYIHGIGRTSATKICAKAEITPDSKTDVLADADFVLSRSDGFDYELIESRTTDEFDDVWQRCVVLAGCEHARPGDPHAGLTAR